MDKLNIKNFVIWSRQILDENNHDNEDNYEWFMRLVIIGFMEFAGYINKEFKKSVDEKDNYKFKLCFFHQWNKVYLMFPEIFSEIKYEDMKNMPYDITKEKDVALYFIKFVDEELFTRDGVLDVGSIGWIHQYYVSINRPNIISYCKENKLHHEHIGCLTQLFTPYWITRYLVENSLGRICMDNEFCNIESDEVPYFIESQYKRDEEEQYIVKSLKEVKVIDPCMGCGHIFLYAFDFLMEQYRKMGYSKKEAVAFILNENLYGLDIDYKVYKLCYFSLCIKAMEQDNTFLNGSIRPKVYCINETTDELKHLVDKLEKWCYNMYSEYNENLMIKIRHIIDSFCGAMENGSLIQIQQNNYEDVYHMVSTYRETYVGFTDSVIDELLNMIHVAQVLGCKYHIVITNPPYLSKRIYSKTLADFLKKYYDISKFDLYAVFIQHSMENLCMQGGYISMITIHTWMFLSSFEKLRKEIISKYQIVSMIHLGAAAFEDLNAYNALSSAFCIKKTIKRGNSVFVKLSDISSSKEKSLYLKEKSRYYIVNQHKFKNIVGWPMVYWITNKEMDIFAKSKTLGDLCVIKQGMATSDNKRFLRYWYEVPLKKIGFHLKNLKEAESSEYKWFPYNKGGDYRKWYGNNELVVNWEKGGIEIRKYTDTLPQGSNVRLKSSKFYFKKGITWSLFGFENFGVRYKEEGFIFDVAGSSLFTEEKYLLYMLGFLCSNVAFRFLSYLAPTVNFQISDVRQLPFIYEDNYLEEINDLCKQCIEICKEEWDDYETSWDFKSHPFMRYGKYTNLKDVFNSWQDYTENRVEKIKCKEERLNKIFIDIYGLQGIVDYKVCERDLSVRRAQRRGDVVSFISYVTSCILGRYDSGLKDFKPSKHGISVMLKNIYYEYDIMAYFEKFLVCAFGESNLSNNMNFIASSLRENKKEDTPKDIIKKYYMMDFFKEHMKIYKKHPVYWHFPLEKKKKFHIYIYMFSYDDYSFCNMSLYIDEVMKKHGEDLLPEERVELIDAKTRLDSLGKDPIKLDENCDSYENYMRVKSIL